MAAEKTARTAPPRDIILGARGVCPCMGGSLLFSMNRTQIIRQFLSFLARSGKWWMMPLVLMLLLLGAVLVFAKGSAIAPFIYSLF